MRLVNHKYRCSFCNKSAKSGTLTKNNKLVAFCRECTLNLLPALIADALFIPVQSLEAFQSQNQEMPHHYQTTWDLVKNTFLEQIISHLYNPQEFLEYQGTLISTDYLARIKKRKLTKKA